MKHVKYLRAICFTCLMLVMGDVVKAQFPYFFPAHAVGTLSGKVHFNYNETPDQLVELYPPGMPFGLTYQWESSTLPLTGFTPISGATQTSYTFSGPLTQTTYFRRKTTNMFSMSTYSNTLKIQVVSVNWEDRNYVREHEVRVTGVTTWTAVDQLPIGDKMQTTTYLDGLGRPVQQISRETATPASGSLWGDVVQFHTYDAMGREPKEYLNYTTTAQSGKYKTDPVTDQAQYYSNAYNETSTFTAITYDNSPLERVVNVKMPGTSWAASPGNSTLYDMNDANDNVRNFGVDYIQGAPPVNNGTYQQNVLYKITSLDEDGKKVIEYINKTGQTILKKVQSDNSPALGHSGWVCTYNVYDDFGLLRFQLQPEAVNYLENNSWSFSGVNGQQVLNEWCFQYNYDDKKRIIWKKTPGASPVKLIYDNRDRLVFLQDGNQALLTIPQWTVQLYDALDRPVLKALYNTTKTIGALQSDIDNAIVNSSVVITNAANTGGTTITCSVHLSPLTSAILNNSSSVTALEYSFYDNYSFPLAKAFNNNYNNLSAYSNSAPNIMPIAATNRNNGRITGAITRVLGGNNFIASTYYYDKDGGLQQELRDNVKSGTDIQTLQYHFNGEVVSTCSDHTTSGTGFSNFKILNKYNLDKIGRTISIEKQIGGNPFKTVASCEYDDMDRLKIRNLDPGYNGGASPLESLNYTYNITSQITGINKDYALKNPANYDKWGHFFGMYLGYDNRDNVFSQSQLSGRLTGILWNTQGDDVQRRYDYSYDNAGRLSNAAFLQQDHPGDGWSNSKMDFSVTGASGHITYDLNGNLLNMLQKGVIPGTPTPITVDNLSYTYASYSNKLQNVTDQMTTTAVNGQSGDFKDGANGSGVPDYVYDANGNIVVDLNKNLQSLNGGAPGTKGISYNFMDKPELIRIVGKGTVGIVYSGSGEKLQRVFIPEGGGASTITTYINDFIYQETAVVTTSSPTPLGGVATLAHINFEEGRIRVITPVSQNNGLDALSISGNITLPNGKEGVFDYFIKDYQQNTRMVLTEETHNISGTCTMEMSRDAIETPVFGQMGTYNEVTTTRSSVPGGWSNGAIGSSVSRIGNIAGYNIGPNTLQKVMAGDKISAEVLYYYQGAAGGVNPDFSTDVIVSLRQAILGSVATSSLLKSNAIAATNQLDVIPGFMQAIVPPGSGGSTPEAYLTILFFDERFNFIEAADGGVWQEQIASSVGSGGSSLDHINIKAPKNGFVYVYVSNRSDQHVYFDNFKVGIARGNIIEENHYYAYGLKIAAISSRKAGDANEGKLNNPYLYNGKELDEEIDLGWYDYGYRNYNPQIGRFAQIDPLTDMYPFLTSYQYAGCDPVNRIDVEGLYGGIATTAAAAKVMEEVVVVGYRASSVSASIINVSVNVTSITIKTAITAANVVSSTIGTVQVGLNYGKIFRQGVTDAIINANTLGASTLIARLWGNDPLDAFSSDAEKLEYLSGRAAGDLIALGQSISETKGGGMLLASSAGTGPLGLVLGGVGTLHGTGVGIAASADQAWVVANTTLLIAKMKASSSSSSSGRSSGKPPAKMSKPKAETAVQRYQKWNAIAKMIYPFKTGIEKHHVWPEYLGGPKNGQLVPLHAAYHQLITNRFRELWKYNNSVGIPSAKDVRKIMDQVYKEYPLPGVKY